MNPLPSPIIYMALAATNNLTRPATTPGGVSDVRYPPCPPNNRWPCLPLTLLPLPGVSDVLYPLTPQ